VKAAIIEHTRPPPPHPHFNTSFFFFTCGVGSGVGLSEGSVGPTVGNRVGDLEGAPQAVPKKMLAVSILNLAPPLIAKISGGIVPHNPLVILKKGQQVTDHP
jgi:hypothetical protein